MKSQTEVSCGSEEPIEESNVAQRCAFGCIRFENHAAAQGSSTVRVASLHTELTIISLQYLPFSFSTSLREDALYLRTFSSQLLSCTSPLLMQAVSTTMTKSSKIATERHTAWLRPLLLPTFK